MDNDPQFPSLDKNATTLAALTPVLNQWVSDTVAFQQSRLALADLMEPGQRTLSLSACEQMAKGLRDLILRSVQAGQGHVAVPFSDEETDLENLPIESLQRLSELQQQGLLPGIRLVWPPKLAHLDTWGGNSPQPGNKVSGYLADPSLFDSASTEEDSSDGSSDEGPSSTAPAARRRRGPGDKCAIS